MIYIIAKISNSCIDYLIVFEIYQKNKIALFSLKIQIQYKFKIEMSKKRFAYNLFENVTFLITEYFKCICDFHKL